MKKLLITLGSLVIVGGLVYLLWGGLDKNVVYFVTPTELLAKGNKAVGNPVRLGGMVATNSVKFRDTVLTFKMADTKNSIIVVTTKAPPEMFQEGIGVVVEGSLRADGKFQADRLMVKHGNEYRPPHEGEMPQQIFKALQVEEKS